MKVDPNDLEVDQWDQEVAAVLLDALGKSLAGAEKRNSSGVVTAKDLQRVLAIMSAAIVETDPTLSTLKDFRTAGEYLGEMIGIFAKGLRDERERTGVGLMDYAGNPDRPTVN